MATKDYLLAFWLESKIHGPISCNIFKLKYEKVPLLRDRRGDFICAATQ